MMRKTLPACLLMGAVLLGAALRLATLGNRPMHADEAVQAVKFGDLLERGHYTYDPAEYHGPALHYLSLPVVRLAGVRRLADATEAQLRLLPALLGTALVAGVWVLRRDLGRGAALWGAVLAATSPMLAFYSRYFIAETLLVAFTFGAFACGWRWVRARSPDPAAEPERSGRLRGAGWLVLAGAFIGLMHAAKETCVIAFAAMLVGAGAALALSADARQRARADLPGLTLGAAVLLGVAAVVSALFFSSFLAHPRGILDSVAAYAGYAGRASGRGDASWHLHSWHYYLRLLLWWRGPGGGAWSEGAIALLAVVGVAAGARRRGASRADPQLVRFLGVYLLLMFAIYSAIPYKTPWCILGAWHAAALLAGVGAAFLVRVAPRGAARTLVALVLVAGVAHLAWQAYRASFTACADPGNPYAYAQTTDDVPALARRIEQLAAVRPGERAVEVQVICPNNDYWPLPWYLRRLARVGWHDAVPDGTLAPVLIMSAELEPGFARRLFVGTPPGRRTLYVDLLQDFPGGTAELRPNSHLRAFAAAALWEQYAVRRAQDTGPTKDATP